MPEWYVKYKGSTSLSCYLYVYDVSFCLLEVCHHQSVANQQLPISGDSLHKMANSSTPDFLFPHPHTKGNKKVVWPHKAKVSYLFSLSLPNTLTIFTIR